MGCRGVHFAISAQEAERLLAAEDDDELVGVVEEIEEEWDAAYETDKAWDALHRSHDEKRIEVWSRTGDEWTRATAGRGEQASLQIIACTLDVDGIYRDPLSA